VREDEIVHYEYHEALGVSRKQSDVFYDQLGAVLHGEAQIRPGAQLVINRLFKQHYIHFITARTESMRQVSLDWFKSMTFPMTA